MFKGKLVVLSLIAAALLCWQMMGVNTVNSGIVDPDSSGAMASAGWYLVCPQGDGDDLDAIGCQIAISVADNTGAPIPGILGSDFWMIGANGGLLLCGGSGSSDADSATNSMGMTTMSDECAAGGCDTQVKVVCQGIVISSVVPITVVSPDINADGLVDLIDLAAFAASYQSPPKPYDYCKDYNGDGLINLIDFSIFAQHYLHGC
jgi:hypothetical protein